MRLVIRAFIFIIDILFYYVMVDGFLRYILGVI